METLAATQQLLRHSLKTTNANLLVALEEKSEDYQSHWVSSSDGVWISVQNVMEIHPTDVEIFQSSQK